MCREEEEYVCDFGGVEAVDVNRGDSKVVFFMYGKALRLCGFLHLCEYCN